MTRLFYATVFRFNGHLYEQIDGAAMASPIAFSSPDVCVNWLLRPSTPLNLNRLPDIVDDFFAFLRTEVNYVDTISKIHQNIYFSTEVEVNDQLANLDVLITENRGKLDTRVLRKSTNTGLHTKWTSLSPLK